MWHQGACRPFQFQSSSRTPGARRSSARCLAHLYVAPRARQRVLQARASVGQKGRLPFRAFPEAPEIHEPALELHRLHVGGRAMQAGPANTASACMVSRGATRSFEFAKCAASCAHTHAQRT